MTDLLFRPIDIGPLSLPNRIVMAPMSRYMSPGNVPHEGNAAYYARRAENGVGLIISEGTYPAHASAHGYENVPQFYGDKALAGWKNVADAVHAKGGKFMPQLWHCGSYREIGMPPEPELPGWSAGSYENPARPTTHPSKAMSDTDIADVIGAYAKSAGSAKELGCDGVEIHGAHGYLIDEFFWGESNKRDDQWGGDLQARTRFAVEILKAVRAEVGPDFPVSFRFSQWKQQDFKARMFDTPDDLEPWLGKLVDAGVSIFHCSQRRFWHSEFDGSDLTLAGWTKKLTGMPTIVVGSVGLASGSFEHSDVEGLEKLEERLARDEFDLVAVGRAILADAEWAKKVKDGQIKECRPFDKKMLASLD